MQAVTSPSFTLLALQVVTSQWSLTMCYGIGSTVGDVTFLAIMRHGIGSTGGDIIQVGVIWHVIGF